MLTKAGGGAGRQIENIDTQKDRNIGFLRQVPSFQNKASSMRKSYSPC